MKNSARLEKQLAEARERYVELLKKHRALILAEHAVLKENAYLKDFINGLQITTSLPVIPSQSTYRRRNGV